MLLLVLMVALFLFSSLSSAARLPEVGGDTGSWGTVLNDFLNVSLAGNGTIRNNSVNSSMIFDDSITDEDIWNSTNLTLGQRITFSNGVVVDNAVTNLFTVTGNSNITSNLSLGGGITFEKNITLNSGTYQVGYRAPSGGTPSLFFTIPQSSAFAWFINTVQIMTLVTSGTDIVLNLSTTSAGADVLFNVMHTDNSNAASDAGVTIRSGGSLGGNPYLLWGIGPGNSDTYTMGIDNNDVDKLVIAAGNSLSSSRFVTFSSQQGVVTFSANLSANNTAQQGSLRLASSNSLFGYGAATNVTIATTPSGQLSVSRSYHGVLNASSGSFGSSILNINGTYFGLQDGDVVILKPGDSLTNITAVHNYLGGGNLLLAGQANFTMDNNYDRLVLQYDGSYWVELSRSNANS